MQIYTALTSPSIDNYADTTLAQIASAEIQSPLRRIECLGQSAIQVLLNTGNRKRIIRRLFRTRLIKENAAAVLTDIMRLHTDRFRSGQLLRVASDIVSQCIFDNVLRFVFALCICKCHLTGAAFPMVKQSTLRTRGCFCFHLSQRMRLQRYYDRFLNLMLSRFIGKH